MPKVPRTAASVGLAAAALLVLAAVLLSLLAATGRLVPARQPAANGQAEPGFPQAAVDYFAAMDDGVALDADAVRGRNTWLMWTAGNEAFWDYLARRSFGTFDLLKVLDSRNRQRRFAQTGLMNEPGFKQASSPDAFGLWLDAPDGTRDGSRTADYREQFSKADFLRTYGRASGIVGLRLFPNPNFDQAARQHWDAQRFYNDRAYYGDEKLVRPYRVGMACGFCHVGPHPLHPPDDPEHPAWRNLSSNIGNQYLRPAGIFVLPGNEDNFLYQVVHSMPPGTIDTSALATDNINNPRTMNAIYQVGTRLKIAAQAMLSGGNLAMPGTAQSMAVPHVLKDGADSIGIDGALARVYFSIGSYFEEWIKHFTLIVGGTAQSPISIAYARKNSPYVRATFARLANVAKFFVAESGPHPLAKAPGGAAYLKDDATTVARGQKLFADNCAACHVSPNKMPAPPASVERYSQEWETWTRSDDFKSKMSALMRQPDFLTDNFLSTDRRIPLPKLGSNACAALATNALAGHIWDNFSSKTYKDLPPAGTIGVSGPFTAKRMPYAMPGGGRGYFRVPSLVSIWASAPYLLNNSVGLYNADPSVAGRMAAFEDGMEKLLWPDKRAGLASVYRTTVKSWLPVNRTYLPVLFGILEKALPEERKGKDTIRLGPIPKGAPVNLLANVDLALSFDPGKFVAFGKAAVAVYAALRDISDRQLDDAAAAARLKELVPRLLALSKCPDFVTDGGHLFGTGLADGDKRALIGYLKRL